MGGCGAVQRYYAMGMEVERRCLNGVVAVGPLSAFPKNRNTAKRLLHPPDHSQRRPCKEPWDASAIASHDSGRVQRVDPVPLCLYQS